MGPVGLDPAVWLAAVPPARIPRAARKAAKRLWAASGLTPGPGEVRHYAGVLEFVLEGYPQIHPELGLHFHIENPRENPLAVFTGRFAPAADPSAQVRTLTCADDIEHAVEPHRVEEFAAPHLGTGLRVLRHYADPDHGVITALRYAWHIPERDAVVLLKTSEPDPPRVLRALDDIDAFARTLRLTA